MITLGLSKQIGFAEIPIASCHQRMLAQPSFVMHVSRSKLPLFFFKASLLQVSSALMRAPP